MHLYPSSTARTAVITQETRVLKEKIGQKNQKGWNEGDMFTNGAGDAAKRKADDNPLLKAAKKQKKDSKTSKRKLAGAEETRGGLLIVRAPSAQPAFPSSQPATSTSTLPPPNKKFRAASQPVVSSLHPRARLQDQIHGHGTPDPDPVLERAVRDMDDEVDRIRRTSRAPVTLGDDVPVEGGQDNPFAFRPPGREVKAKSAKPPSSSQGQARSTKPPSKSQPKSKLGTKIRDTSQPVELNETPKIERNKLLREGSLALIREEGEEGERGRGMEVGGGGRHRRKSSLSRGKRISSSYETGVITQPHPSVADSSFYKHIDAELPDAERIRQLLIWCSLRASGSSLGSSSFTPSKPKPSPALESLPTASSLPALSDKAKQALREAQDEIVRIIAEKKVDLSLHSAAADMEGEEGETVENEQNVRNRKWEVVYGGHVKKAQEEEESWKKVSFAYEAYAKKVQAGIEKDLASISTAGPSRARSISVDPEGEIPSTPSAKSKGKQREAQQIRVDDLPEDLQRGWMLAREVMQPSTQVKGKGRAEEMPSQITTSSKVEKEIKKLLPDLQLKLDSLFAYAARAKAVVGVMEQMINERFKILDAHLEARLKPPSAHSSSSSGATHLLTTYVPSSSSSTFTQTREDPQSLLRALSRIDSARPPAQVGDAARKAAREVQRVNTPVAGERRLTMIGPAGFGTPRKAPGTPRRAGTPGRERERERER